MYIFSTERKSFYTIIKNRNLDGSGDPDENFNGLFMSIAKVELIRIMSKRKAIVKISRLFCMDLPVTVTITFRKGLVMIHNYDSRFRSFDPNVLCSLEEIFNLVTKDRLFNFYKNEYLSNRLNNIVVKRINKIINGLDDVDNRVLLDYNIRRKLKLPMFKKFYNTIRWISHKFKPMLNNYYKEHNDYPERYKER